MFCWWSKIKDGRNKDLERCWYSLNIWQGHSGLIIVISEDYCGIWLMKFFTPSAWEFDLQLAVQFCFLGQPAKVVMLIMLLGNIAYSKNDPWLVSWFMTGNTTNTLQEAISLWLSKCENCYSWYGPLLRAPKLLQDTLVPVVPEAFKPWWLLYLPDIDLSLCTWAVT